MTPTHIHNPTGDNDGVQIEDKDTQGLAGKVTPNGRIVHGRTRRRILSQTVNPRTSSIPLLLSGERRIILSAIEASLSST